MPQLIRPLPPGPLAIIGDVHGEIDALRHLLRNLGGDLDGGVPGRHLVFVGDLVDRGPDSPGVVHAVARLVASGRASCVAGNHELNLLGRARKEGNGWFFGHNDRFYVGPQRRGFDSAPARDRDAILDFCQALPVALVRDDLRVVHAAWSDRALSMLPDQEDIAQLAGVYERRIDAQLRAEGLRALEAEQLDAIGDIHDPRVTPAFMPAARQDVAFRRQNDNPVKVLLSGPEERIQGEMFYTGGKWRTLTRAHWWKHYSAEAAVIVGHYWRWRQLEGGRPAWDDKPDDWGDYAFNQWAGPRANVMCIDYSVGRRYLERAHGGPRGRSIYGLAALTWPERQLVFDDHGAPIDTIRPRPVAAR